jgi:fructosamine-3-kinase
LPRPGSAGSSIEGSSGRTRSDPAAGAGHNRTVRSPTQRQLAPVEVARYADRAFGVGIDECAELPGGGFAAVWRVALADGRLVVLKVGPSPEARLLRYEAGLIAAEAHYFRLVAARAPQVPMPRVLHHEDDWLFTGYLSGAPLAGEETAVRRQLGAAVAHLHAVTGDRFGYSGERAHASTWRVAFAAIIDDLLADAADWQVSLPVPPEVVRSTVAAHAGRLAAVTRPALLHFDLWDGNVLVGTDPAGAPALSGLVDGERYLYGDPLIDFVSPALFRRIEDQPDHPFLLGYADTTGTPVRFDAASRCRLALYRLHLYLLMLVEMPSRGMTGPAGRPRTEQLTTLLRQELDYLGGG